MRFVFNGDVYAISFRKAKTNVVAYSGFPEATEALSRYPNTIVTLHKLDNREFGLKNAEVVAYGNVACYHKDTYNYEVGRRLALKDLCTSQRNRGGSKPKVTREMSALIWKAYFNRNNPDVEVSGGNNTPPTTPSSEAVSADFAVS